MPAEGSPRAFDSPLGTFTLQRYPRRKHERLQAWCSADSLLLQAFLERDCDAAQTLVVNDEHGALSVASSPAACWTDSWLSAEALAQNLERNGRSSLPVHWASAPPPANMQTVLIRVPKQLAFFEYQLAQLSQQLPAGALVIAAGMDKHLSPHTAEALERHIGPTTRHRGRAKARTFSATFQRSTTAPSESTSYYCDALQADLIALPGVFSGESLDQGTRLMLDHLHRLDGADTAADLACGNGVIGLVVHRRELAEKIVFCDESAMAIASARSNWDGVFGTGGPVAQFVHGDGLLQVATPPDLILCNPPFHQQHAVDEWVGVRLIQQCANALPQRGQLCLVANRHLNYLAVLKRLFADVQVLAENAKFRLYLARQA